MLNGAHNALIFWGKAPSRFRSAQGPGEVPDLAVALSFDSALARFPLEQLTWARYQVHKENVGIGESWREGTRISCLDDVAFEEE